MPSPPPMYRASLAPAAYCLRQGEIFSGVVEARLALDSVGTNAQVVEYRTHPFAVLMTQDCDLSQDFAVRRRDEVNDKLLPGLLFCEAATADELLGRLGGRRKEWDRMNIDKNKNERYHFLQLVDAVCDARQIGLPELGIDFKRFFTLPTAEVYRRVELGEAHRRAVLVSPYLEHLSSRFAHFLSRVALPQDHLSE